MHAFLLILHHDVLYFTRLARATRKNEGRNFYHLLPILIWASNSKNSESVHQYCMQPIFTMQMLAFCKIICNSSI